MKGHIRVLHAYKEKASQFEREEKIKKTLFYVLAMGLIAYSFYLTAYQNVEKNVCVPSFSLLSTPKVEEKKSKIETYKAQRTENRANILETLKTLESTCSAQERENIAQTLFQNTDFFIKENQIESLLYLKGIKSVCVLTAQSAHVYVDQKIDEKEIQRVFLNIKEVLQEENVKINVVDCNLGV